MEGAVGQSSISLEERLDSATEHLPVQVLQIPSPGSRSAARHRQGREREKQECGGGLREKGSHVGTTQTYLLLAAGRNKAVPR